MSIFKKRDADPPLIGLAKLGYSIISMATHKSAMTIYAKGDDLERLLVVIKDFIATLPKDEANQEEEYKVKGKDGSTGYA